MTHPYLGRLYFHNALHHIHVGQLANARESFTKARAFLSKDAASQNALVDSVVYFVMKQTPDRRESLIRVIAEEYEQHAKGWAKHLRSQFYFASAYEALSTNGNASRAHAARAMSIRPALIFERKLLSIVFRSFATREAKSTLKVSIQNISDETKREIEARLDAKLERVERIGGGGYSGSPIYRVSIGGQRAVLRLAGEQGLGECLPALRRAHELGLPVPKIISSDEAASRWLLEEEMPGAGLDLNATTQDRAKRLLTELGSHLNRLHQVSTKGFGAVLDKTFATKFVTFDEWLSGQFGALYLHCQRGRLTETSFEALDRAAQTLRASFGSARLCHGDLIGNVLVDGDRVTGIIDWGMAMGCDPAFDVASVKFTIDSSARSSAERRELYDAFLSAYGHSDAEFARRVFAHELLYAAFLSGLELREEDRALKNAWQACFVSLLRQK
jgi:aminoglycoside phosphotransferase (APT) family kinase protein